jgi:hypothetical protein
MRTFEAISGRKREHWLARTVGVLVTSIGAGLRAAAKTSRVDHPVAIVGAGSALGPALIELHYSGRRVVSPVYAAEAVIEQRFAAAWWPTLRRAAT